MPRRICDTCGSTFSCCNTAEDLKSWRSICCTPQCYEVYLEKHFAWLESQNKPVEVIAEQIEEPTIKKSRKVVEETE